MSERTERKRRNKRKMLEMGAGRQQEKSTGRHPTSLKKERKGREGQTHLRGGESESVRVSRQGEIRDMTHHAGAAHRRANTLKVRKK